MTPAIGQVVGYARVSSTDRNLERQLVAIGDVDWVFTDKVSGRARADRVELTQCLDCTWGRATPAGGQHG